MHALLKRSLAWKRYRRCLIAGFFCTACFFGGGTPHLVLAADPADEVFKSAPTHRSVKLTDLERAQIEELCDDLGSMSFAKRERAANALMAYGRPVAEPMQAILKQISDPEVVERGQKIIDTLVGEDNAKKIDAFLRGENIDFWGWRSFRNLLGDNLAVRELFVEVRAIQPQIVGMMETGTPREISIATTRMVDQTIKKRLTRIAMPDRGEVIALFLPVSDQRVPISVPHERMLFRLLNQNAVSLLRKHEQLKDPFERLVEMLLKRSSKESRFDALFHGMAMKLAITDELARQTLREAAQGAKDGQHTLGLDAISTSMRAICELGDRSDAILIEPFLEDSRQAADDAFRDGRAFRIQLADVAMAAIAILYNVPLAEIGYPDAIQTQAKALYTSELGFPVDQPEQRIQNRQKLMRLVAAIRKSDLQTKN